MTGGFEHTVELNLSADEGTLLEVLASVEPDGDLIVFGQSVGPAPIPLAGSQTHDHWIAVAAEDKDVVLLRLLRERFQRSAAPDADFMNWLQDHDIPHHVGSTVGDHRGAFIEGPRARISAKTRRRNGTQRQKPTRAGP